MRKEEKTMSYREEIRRIMQEEFSKQLTDIFLFEKDNDKGMRIGLAVYGQKGYEIIDDGNNNTIENFLRNEINPIGKISRGQSFSPIVKKEDNIVGITVPVQGSGAGGAQPFVSLALYNTNKTRYLPLAAEHLIKADIDKIPSDKKYGLQKIASMKGK